MKNKGFSLIECTIYLALFSFISVLFLSVASRAQLKFMSVSFEQENLHRQTLALDLLRRDLMSASQYSADWDLQQFDSQNYAVKQTVLKHSVLQQSVFKKLTLNSKNLPQTVDISWFIGSQGLMRAQGEYDFVKHEWINRTSCIVCKSIKEINFILQKSSDLQNNEKKDGNIGVWVVYTSTGPVPSQKSLPQNSFEQNSLGQKFFVKFRNRVVV